jgi:outer membrane protein OmpA-like peptidoglycan-associated protein
MDERALGWIGIATFSGLCLLCLMREAGNIEAEIHSSGVAALDAAGIAATGLTVTGRDVLWKGVADDDLGIIRVGEILEGIPGVRSIRVSPIPRTLTPAEIVEGRLARATIFHPIRFLPNSATLVPDTRQSLDIIAGIIAGEPDAQIVIEGHTDSRGDPQANLELSRERAETVRRHLILHGIAPERLHTRGYGDSAPIADNDTAAGRRDNRRIVFRVKE